MDRYELLSKKQKEILDKLFWYLGFNEATDFEGYVNYFFKGVKERTMFVHMLNRNIDFIVREFTNKFPEYKNFKCYWLTEENFDKHVCVGSEVDYDPKGLLRYFVRNNFQELNKKKPS